MWSSDENLGRLLQEVDKLFPAPMEKIHGLRHQISSTCFGLDCKKFLDEFLDVYWLGFGEEVCESFKEERFKILIEYW